MRLPQRLLAFFLSFVLIFISTPSFAADPNDFRKPNQWQRERTINDAINKSSVKVEAQKTYPVSTLDQNGKPIKQIRNAKATIKLGASTANVGKSLLKRAPAIAITQAVIAILGKSVDWVMDPENNRVKYKDPENSGGYYWEEDGRVFYSHDAVCNYLLSRGALPTDLNHPWNKGARSSTWTDKYRDTCRFQLSNGSYTTLNDLSSLRLGDPDTQPEWQYIPIDEVAQKVIRHAEDGQAPAMQVMNDAALDALEAGLLDAQLDAASNVPQPDPQEITQAQYDNPDYPENGTGTGTGPETPVDPETPTDPVDPNPNPNPDANPFQLPPFCSWASKVCDFIDWYQKDPPDDTEIELPEPDMPDVDTDIDFGGSCPPDLSVPFNLYGTSTDFVLMPFSKFCPLLESYIRPVLILLGSFMAVTIVGGRRDG